MKNSLSPSCSLNVVHATITRQSAEDNNTCTLFDNLKAIRSSTPSSPSQSTSTIPQFLKRTLTASIPNSATDPSSSIVSSLLRNLKGQEAVGEGSTKTGHPYPGHKVIEAASSPHVLGYPSPDTARSSPSPSQPSTPQHHIFDCIMSISTSASSPIDIATSSRTTSSSPSSQGYTHSKMSGMSLSREGAKPIQMNNPSNRGQDSRMRRESFANNGSFVQNSFGGVSVGSWIREDIMMSGTSPYPYRTPSFHSSSYLPKLEADFLKEFSCCGKTLPSLHDLLTHYEECHAQQTPQSLRSASIAQQERDSQSRNGKPTIAIQSAATLQQQQRQQNYQQTGRAQSGMGLATPASSGSSALSSGIQQMRQAQSSQPSTPTQARATPEIISVDMEGVESMDMDDPIEAIDSIPASVNNIQVNGVTGFGSRPALNLTNTNGMVHQGLRTAQPTTPSTSAFGFQNNPTVSSVNTPTLSAAAHGNFSPDTSVPGTPAELDDDYANLLSMNNMPMGGNMNVNLSNLNNMGNMNLFGLGNDLGLDLCIDEPAKRLYSPNGGFGTQQHRQIQQQLANFNLNGGGNQYVGMNFAGMSQLSNEDIMRRLQQQKFLAQMQGLGGMSGQSTNIMGMNGEEHKPFKCPVIGCEKAYKNQNGLKYHKTHGHMTQQLHENGDGTFSIVNPETSTPYPGTMGMEKEKPYKCDVCGKRYKNLNGLKYHKQHSPPCNPEIKLNGNHLPLTGLSGGLGGLPGSGLTGIGE